MTNFKHIVATTAFSMLLLVLPVEAFAALIIKIDDGVNPAKIIYDEVAAPPPGTNPDLAAGIPGKVFSLVFFYGNWTSISAEGTSKPLQGEEDSPDMTLFVSAASSVANAGTLTVSLTDTGFKEIPPYFESSFSTTPNGTVQVSTYVDFTNAAFGTGTLLKSFAPFAPPPLSYAESVMTEVFGSTPYSLTTIIKITHTATGSSSTVGSRVIGDVNSVPEPSTWALFGLGLVSLVGWGWRHRRLAH